MQKMGEKKKEKILNIILVLIWGGLILFCIRNRDFFTPDAIASLKSENIILTVLMILGLFGLKSLSIVIYCGVLYAADGILFPLWAAVLVNMAGSAVMVSVPYLIGRKKGRKLLKDIHDKYPKTEILNRIRSKSDFLTVLISKMIPLPGDIISMYMGARETSYVPYLLGSLLGLFPHMVAFPLLSTGLVDGNGSETFISLGVEVLCVIVALVSYRVIVKRRGKDENRSN